MSEDDLKIVLAKYQQKSFDLFNKNIVMEAQVESLTEKVKSLNLEIEKLKKSKRNVKTAEDFQ
jgi:prefoldin subunit 5